MHGNTDEDAVDERIEQIRTIVESRGEELDPEIALLLDVVEDLAATVDERTVSLREHAELERRVAELEDSTGKGMERTTKRFVTLKKRLDRLAEDPDTELQREAGGVPESEMSFFERFYHFPNDESHPGGPSLRKEASAPLLHARVMFQNIEQCGQRKRNGDVVVFMDSGFREQMTEWLGDVSEYQSTQCRRMRTQLAKATDGKVESHGESRTSSGRRLAQRIVIPAHVLDDFAIDLPPLSTYHGPKRKERTLAQASMT